MKRWFTTFLAVLVCSAALRADVTIVQTTTVEGGMATMAAQAGAGANMSPKITTRVKGMKTRTDVETGPGRPSRPSSISTTKQVIILRPDQKTATMVSAVPPATTPPARRLPAGGAAGRAERHDAEDGGLVRRRPASRRSSTASSATSSRSPRR